MNPCMNHSKNHCNLDNHQSKSPHNHTYNHNRNIQLQPRI